MLQRPTFVPWLIACGCMLLLSCGGGAESLEPVSITRTQRVWTDISRATPSNGTYPGAPTRTLRVLIWEPAEKGPFPLLVMAHGFGGLPEKFDAFARTVAAAGTIVAAPAFPLTNENAPGGHETALSDTVNQPADLSFVISQLLDAARQPSDALAGSLIPSQIAVLGHSLGGATVIGLTRKSCCRDERVAASILVAAPSGLADLFFPGGQTTASGLPTLIMQGTADATLPYSNAVMLYDSTEPPRILVGLDGAGHSDALESQIEPPVPARDAAQRATIAFLAAVFKENGALLSETLAALSAEGDTVESDWGS